MSRTIYQRLCQLLRSLLGRAGSDPDDQAEQDTDHADTESGGDADRDADDRPDTVEDDSDDTTPPAADETDDDGDAGDPNHSQDEASGMNWPPTPCVEWPDRPENPAATIAIKLYYREGDAHGREACRICQPHIEWALLDAWGDRFDLDVDIAIHDEAVPAGSDGVTDPGDFDDWVWDAVGSAGMAKDCNLLIADIGAGAAGGYTGYVNGPHYFAGKEWTDDSCVVAYGGGSKKEGIGRVLHEALHCLGITHDDAEDQVEYLGTQYTPPMLMSYDQLSRYTISLSSGARTSRPTVQPEGAGAFE